MSIKLNGATSGSVELDVPAAVTGGDVSLSLPGAGTVDRLERAGNILQVVSTTVTDVKSASAPSGGPSGLISGFTVNITPSSASSKIYVLVDTHTGVDSNYCFITLRRDSTSIAIGDANGSRQRITTAGNADSNYEMAHTSMQFLDSPSTTSQITYGILLSHTSGQTRTVYLNRGSLWENTNYYATPVSTITVMEVAA